MAIDFRFNLLTGEDAEIATVMQGQPKGLQGKSKVCRAGPDQAHTFNMNPGYYGVLQLSDSHKNNLVFLFSASM